jgi:Ca-activated chloride channel family protein
LLFLWSGFLLLLGLIPLLIAVYLWILRRKRRTVLRYSNLNLVRKSIGKTNWVRQHLPFVIFNFALISLVLAMARPVAAVSIPTGQSTVILTIDVSLSMCQSDIKPNRLEAAKQAALDFIDNQESSTQIGIVAFAGFAELVQEPTNDQDALRSALLGLRGARRTAIGSAILKALDTIAEVYEDVAPADEEPQLLPGLEDQVAGNFAPYVIVLLTDGVSNSGPEPLFAAEEAAARGVRVYTIGFGTAGNHGPIPPCSSEVDQPDAPFGPSGFGSGGGGGFRRGIDEITLQQVSSLTGAQYYPAESAEQLQEVFENLPTHPVFRHEFTEISSLFAGLGAVFVILALVLSWIWKPLF